LAVVSAADLEASDVIASANDRIGRDQICADDSDEKRCEMHSGARLRVEFWV